MSKAQIRKNDLQNSGVNPMENELDEIRKKLENLQKKNEENEFLLRERKKELACHNQITKLLSMTGLAQETVISEIVNIIPPAWQHPEFAQASITIRGYVFQTAGYQKTDYFLKQPVSIDGVTIGEVEVNYPNDFAKEQNPVFLAEEHDLLLSIAGRLGDFILDREWKMALQKSESKYRNIFENVQEAYLETMPDGTILEVSPSIEIVSRGDYSRLELIGKSIYILYANPEERNRLMAELVKNRKAIDFRITYQSKIGGNRQISVSSHLIVDSEGHPEKILSILRDITEHETTEGAYRQSKEKLRIIAENTYHWEFWEGPDGKSIYHSPSSKMFTGIDSSELEKDSSAIFDLIHPEDREEYRKHHRESRLEFKPRKHLFRMIGKNGKLTYIEHVCQPVFDENKQFLGIRGTNIDVTERKLATDAVLEQERRANLHHKALIDITLDTDVISLKMPDSLNRITEIISVAANVAGVAVWKFSMDLSELTCISSYDKEKKQHHSGGILRRADYPIYFSALISAGYTSVVDTYNDKLTEELRDSYFVPRGITSSLDIGFIQEGKMMGVLCLQHKGPKRKWQPDEEAFANTAASIISQLFANLELKRVEQELQESNRKIKVLMNNLKGVAYRCNNDRSWTMDFISQGIFELTGYEHTDFIDSRVRDYNSIIHPDDQQMVWDDIQKGISSRIPYTLEYRIITSTGQVKWVWEKGQGVFDGDQLLALEGFISDITGRKEAETILRESEFKFRALFESASVGMVMVTRDMNVQLANPKFTDLTGYTAEDIDTIDKWWIKAYPDEKYRHEVLSAWNDDVQAYLTGKVSKFHTNEAKVRCKDGSDRYFEISFVTTGEINIVTFVDVTERKLNAIQLEYQKNYNDSILGAIPDLMFILDSNGTFIEFKSGKEDELAFPPEMFLNKMVADVLPEPLSSEIISAIHQVLNGNTVAPVQYKMPVKGILYDYEARFSRFGNDKVIVLVSNITWRKQTELALKENEQKYRLIAENTSDGILILDKTNTSIYISPGYLRQMGYKSDDKPVLNMELINNLIHPDERDDLFKFIFDALGRQTENLTYTYRAKHQQGHYIWLEDKTHFTYDADGSMFSAHIVSRDVSERKEAEKQLRQSEEKYRSLIDSSDAAIMLVDKDGTFLFVNTIAAVPWNMTTDEIVGLNVRDFFPPEQVKEMMNNFDKVISSNTGMSFEADSIIGKEKKWLRISLQPVRDSAGKPYAALMFASDITERRNAVENVIKSEKKYRTLFDDSPDSLMILQNGAAVECNRACETLFRTTREQLIGSTPTNFAPEYQPGGKRSDEYAASVINEVMKTGTVDFEWLHKRLDKSEFLADVNLTIIEFEGQPAILTRVKDITASRLAEEKLRKLSRAVEQSPVSIVIANKDGFIEYANPRACETTGYMPEELIGKNPRVLQSGETTKEVYVNMWDKITAGNQWQGTFLNKRKNGELYWESATIAPILDASGKITHYVALKEDITERREMQLALQRSQERFIQITEQSQIVIWEVDENGIYTYVSPVSEIVFGYSPEELIGKKYFFDLHPEEVRAFYKKSGQDLLAQQSDLKNFENPIQKKNGEIIWVSTNAVPFLDAKGKILGYRGADHDITDRRIAEEEMRKFRTITDQANYGAAIADPTGILLYSNDAFAHMHGWEVSDLLGKHLSMLHSEQQMIRVIETIEMLKKNGGFTAQEVWRTRKDGSVFPSLMNAKIIMDNNNNPQFMSATAIDITDLKEKEEALRRSEDSLNNAQVIANMGSWEFDVTTQKALWSRNYYNLIGIDPSLPPLPLDEIKKMIHPEDKSLFEEKLSEMSQPPTTDSFYFRLITKDDSIKWIQANMVPTFENDKLVSVRGVSIDITEKKEAEEKIRQQNIRLSAIMDAMPDMIFITDKNGKYLEYFKSKANTLLGNYEDLVGKNIRDAFDKNTAELHLRKIKECLSTKQIITYEYPRIENGILKYFEGRIVYMEEEKVLRFVRDITESKHAEREIKKLNLAIEQSPVSIVITDLDANIQYANPTFYKTTGYTPSEAKGINAKILKSGKTPEEVYKDLWQTIKAKKVWHTEWINKKKNGDLYWESISITPIQDEDGEIVNYLAIKQDISERKKAEQEILDLNTNLEKRIIARTKDLQDSNVALEKARIEADKANKAKSEFLSRMSHELRTPMNSILGFAQLLEMGDLNPKQTRGVNHIIKSGKHLLDLINEVLDISRIEAGRLSLSLEPVNLRALLNEMMDLVNPQVTIRNLTIRLVESRTNDCSVKTDRQRLKQILLNLINNAIKYNMEGGSIILKTTQIETTTESLGFIRISVTDTGKGISEENLSKLFTPFERIGAENTLTEGTGLGLTVAKKLTEAMGGVIGVESMVGEGSTFWVQLPAVESQLEHAKKTGAEAIDASSHAHLSGTILYIEDNESNVELIEQILSEQRPGIKMISTVYGEQGIKLAAENQPDIILLDLNLPDIQGDEVLLRLQTDKRTMDIPVIMLSADAMPRQVSKLLKAGAAEYLTKPIDVVVFLEVIDELLLK